MALDSWTAVVGVALCLPALGASQAPEFSEVYNIIKTHAAGVSDAELNRDAVQGLLSVLGHRAYLVTNSPAASNSPSGPLVSKAMLFEGETAYLRISNVSGDLAKEIRSAYAHLGSSNTVRGAVLDLRYCDGDDYDAAAAVADLFAAKAEPLLKSGTRTLSSQAKTNAIRVPVAVLVNGETAGAAEALAALMRNTGAGLLLGSQTAGRAMILQDFQLSNGSELRVAVAPVLLWDGSALPSQGLQPDISVAVVPEEERGYFANSFLIGQRTNAMPVARLSLGSPTAGTNAASRRMRLNEAELVREHREGLDRDLDMDAPVRPVEPAKPAVNDPALARALDLVKGLALVRQSRS
ncbi:MAG TPA: S41 family peptidase [Verrucomicrobiae bacterium]|nr:S41 family peptidase [Verrucomicrobiae bacterium]